MNSPIPPTRARYISHIAKRLRSRQAHGLRGQREHLEQLDSCSDFEIVARFAWTAAISAGLCSFIGAPALMVLGQGLLPANVQSALWLLIKIAMGLSAVAFVGAISLMYSTSGDH